MKQVKKAEQQSATHQRLSKLLEEVSIIFRESSTLMFTTQYLERIVLHVFYEQKIGTRFDSLIFQPPEIKCYYFLCF